jgi:hypothetical protein
MHCTSADEKYQVGFSNCPLLPATGNAPLGRMHHCNSAFHKDFVKAEDYPSNNEYTHQFWQTVIMQLEALLDEV